MDLKPVPQRPPGMSDEAYKVIMARKRRNATRNGIVLGSLAVGFFLFPLAFTTWKNKQGANGMLVNKVTTSPGQSSEPLFKYEQQHGSFSAYTQHQSDAQFASLNPLNTGAVPVEGLTPQEQYAQFKAQKSQQQQRHD